MRTTIIRHPPPNFVKSSHVKFVVGWLNQALNEPTKRSYQFEKDPALEDLLALWPKGKKMLVEFFPWTCFLSIWKTLFHVPHAIASTKTVTSDNTTHCLQKTCLLLFVTTEEKKSLEPSKSIWSVVELLFNQSFFLLAPIIREISMKLGDRKEIKAWNCVTFEVTLGSPY